MSTEQKNLKNPGFYKVSSKETFLLQGIRYTLLVKYHRVKKDCYGMGSPSKFELSISYNKKGKHHNYILQKDRGIPKSRGECPAGYSIEDVYIYKNGIAVIIAYSMPGFEGPDVRQLVVTGKLK